MNSAEVVARLQQVSLRYADKLAVDQVSLEIPARQMVGMIGPDGVGKSSLLALIAGARQIQQGQVDVLGGDMASSRHRRQVCQRQRLRQMVIDILNHRSQHEGREPAGDYRQLPLHAGIVLNQMGQE